MSAALLAVALACAAGAPAAKPIRVGVMALQVKAGDDLERPASLITDFITAEAGKHPGLAVVGPSEIASALTMEQQRMALDCSEGSCAAEIAGALGVQLLLSGSIGRVGSTLVINLSLLEGRTVQVLSRASEVVPGPVEDVLALLPHLVGKLLAAIPGGPPVPPRPELSKRAQPAPDQPAAATPARKPPRRQARKHAPSAGGAPADEPRGSTLPRRLAGAGTAAGGAAVVAAGVALGAASLAYFAASHTALAGTPLGQAPLRYGGFGLAGGADTLGLAGAALLAAGVVVAVLP